MAEAVSTIEDPAARSLVDQADVSPPSSAVASQRKGVMSRIWKGVFGSRKEDYEKKLQYISKEETAVHTRMKRRALYSRSVSRNIVIFSGIVEVVAVAFAITAIRSLDMNWTMKTVRCLPAILAPGLSFIIHTTVVRFTRMLDRKDQKTLERLRVERKSKLDELKERTNYYTTQLLIQRYDLDPAAKAAAASVLASKLGTDSGLKVSLGNESNANQLFARSSDVELLHSSGGLRNRRQSSLSRNDSNVSCGTSQSTSEVPHESQMVVEHHQGPCPSDGGWMCRIAALLVGEDPSHCYALICGNCLRHNGLARREDFPHITYYCPHCHALNTSSTTRTVELESGTNSGISSPQAPFDGSLAAHLARSLSNSSSPPSSFDGSLAAHLARSLSNASSVPGTEIHELSAE